MKDFAELILKHKGKRFCIMGGAPSLADDLNVIEADIYISTNGHGCDIVPVDYVLAMDEVNTKTHRPMLEHIRALTDAPLISRRHFADYQLMTWPQAPRDVLSGMVAAWAPFMMGAKVVDYFGQAWMAYKAALPIHESFLWRGMIACPVRVMSDELEKVWPKYNQSEKFGRYRPHSSINAWLDIDERITIEVVKPTEPARRRIESLKPGFTMQVMRHEVARLLKHKMLREL